MATTGQPSSGIACTAQGTPAEFEGASIIRFKSDRIVYVREYQTTRALYDWEGAWLPY